MVRHMIILIILSLVLSAPCFPFQAAQKEKKADIAKTLPEKEASRTDIDVSKISVRSVTALRVPAGYDIGGFLSEENLLYFAKDQDYGEKGYQLYKYLIMNRNGETIRTLDRVLFWDGDDKMLRVNPLSTLIYHNLTTKTQKIVKLSPEDISSVVLSRFDEAIYYSTGWANKVYRYDINQKYADEIFELKKGLLIFFSMLTAEDLIYVGLDFTFSFSDAHQKDPDTYAELALFMENIRQKKGKELLKLTANGVMTYVNPKTGSLNFMVEEKGVIRLISSDHAMNNRRIDISPICITKGRVYDGVMLQHCSARKDGRLFSSSRARLNRIKAFTPGEPTFYSFKSEMYEVQNADVYLFDLNGKYKQLTNTPDQIEQVIDWNSEGNEILYYDYKGKKFYLIELSYGDNTFKRPFINSTDTSQTIRP